MPAFRNISPVQPSERAGIHSPAIYSQENGWQNPDTINPLSYHNIKVEATYGPAKLQSTPSSSCSPVPHKSSRTRRREDPNYIPRPRNAFFIFRSFYVKSCQDTCDGRQNAMSKDAAAVWNSMTDEQKTPFCEQAFREKEEHYAKYPDYTYAPARPGAKKAKPSSGASSSESPSPLSGRVASKPGCDFIPTSDIPPLSLSPKEKTIPDFALAESAFYHHFDYVPEQFGFHQYGTGASDPTLPPLPRFGPGYNTPAPSSLLSDNPYPSASYLASQKGSYAPTYSFTNDGQHPHFTPNESIRQLDLNGTYEAGYTQYCDMSADSGIHYSFDSDRYF